MLVLAEEKKTHNFIIQIMHVAHLEYLYHGFEINSRKIRPPVTPLLHKLSGHVLY